MSDESLSNPMVGLPAEEVARRPLPGMACPGMLNFSPDDDLVTYLWSPDGGLVRQLYAFDPSSGKTSLLSHFDPSDYRQTELSLEEALRRERLRQLELGIAQYAWAEHANRIMFPLEGNLFVFDGPGAPLRKVLEKPAQAPQISPDGHWVAYVQDDELWVVPAGGGEPRQLTFHAQENGVSHGLAEFIAQEELDRGLGYWWSPDSSQIAFSEVDERHIPVYRIMHQGKDMTGQNAQEDHHYPFAGQANAYVRLGIVELAGGEPHWVDLGSDPDIYLARVNWLLDGSLAVQRLNRSQDRLDLLHYDPSSRITRLWLSETNETWINLHDLFKPLSKPAGFIWGSERTGYRHLYLYDREGNLVHPLTQGEWMVEELAGVDERAGLVYFTATRQSPLEKHLYVVSIAGGEPRQITLEPGIHEVVNDHHTWHFIDRYESLTQPPTVSLRSLADGSLVETIYTPQEPILARLHLQPPELVKVPNRVGIELNGAIYRPDSRFGPGPYPTIVQVYGGPHVQQVDFGWGTTIMMRAQELRSLGYLVFILDNRGSARRGLSFEGALKQRMGSIEVEDQVDGVHWLVEQGLTDPQRVGIYGWSYGGYMAAMCLCQAPEIFRVAVAGAPVTHYDGYDTAYTERYMGTPQSNPEGYALGSVVNHVEKMRGKLLIIHGLIDENVHFRHTARLINALIKARKPYELLLFPDERHMPRKMEDRMYLEERLRDFFLENL